MENSAILSADILDIIFEGRNKAYGAYELRRTYNKRLRISILVMLSLIVLLFLSQLFSFGQSKAKQELNTNDWQLEQYQEPPPPDLPEPPPPPKLPDPPPVKMAAFTNPVITNEEVKPDERPPEIENLENVRIGTSNVTEGTDDVGLVPPPVAEGIGKGIIEPPKKNNPDSLFVKVEIDATYPGGMPAWKRYLIRNLERNIPQVALDNNIQGTVLVEFIVNKEGVVSDVKAISGPEELREAAVNVIKKSGKWNPGIQNGQQVKSVKRQPIQIILQDN